MNIFQTSKRRILIVWVFLSYLSMDQSIKVVNVQAAKSSSGSFALECILRNMRLIDIFVSKSSLCEALPTNIKILHVLSLTNKHFRKATITKLTEHKAFFKQRLPILASKLVDMVVDNVADIGNRQMCIMTKRSLQSNYSSNAEFIDPGKFRSNLRLRGLHRGERTVGDAEEDEDRRLAALDIIEREREAKFFQLLRTCISSPKQFSEMIELFAAKIEICPEIVEEILWVNACLVSGSTRLWNVWGRGQTRYEYLSPLSDRLNFPKRLFETYIKMQIENKISDYDDFECEFACGVHIHRFSAITKQFLNPIWENGRKAEWEKMNRSKIDQYNISTKNTSAQDTRERLHQQLLARSDAGLVGIMREREMELFKGRSST